jgi:hypothetical protein
MTVDEVDDETLRWVGKYVAILQLPTDQLHLTTNRRRFEAWLGRRNCSDWPVCGILWEVERMF